MTTDTRQTDPRDIWQTDEAGAVRLSAGELRARIERLARTARRRNYGAFVVCAIVLAICVWLFMWIDDPLARIGALLIVVGTGTIVFQVRANQLNEQAAVRRASQMGGTASVDFLRADLERQRDFHRGRRLWTRLLLFAPGPQIFFVGFARAHPEVAGTIRLEAIAAVILLLAAVPANLWLARGYQRQLDELDRLQKEQS
jgi:hypothetical protein